VKTLTVTFDEHGDLTYLKTPGDDVLFELGKTITQRASHVEPGPRYERWLFHLLRWLFGNTGRVSEWTRGWNSLWRVNTAPVGGPILRYSHVLNLRVKGDPIMLWHHRQDAIDAEVKFLNEFFLTHNPK
jgi:hypothetical protein